MLELENAINLDTEIKMKKKARQLKYMDEYQWTVRNRILIDKKPTKRAQPFLKSSLYENPSHYHW